MIGIKHIECFIPSYQMSIQELSRISGFESNEIYEKHGFISKPVVKKFSPITIAIQSVEILLEKYTISPETIDYIIYASSGVFDKQFWSPAAHIQHHIKARNAFSFEVNNGCNAGNFALALSKKILNSEKSKKRALIVVSDNLSKIVNYKDRSQSSLFNFSDAACAILIEKNCSQNQISSSVFVTAPEFSDNMFLPKNSDKIKYAFDNNSKQRLKQKYTENYTKVISEATLQSGCSIEAIKAIVMNQGDYKIFGKLSKKINLGESKFLKTYKDYGHMGGVDIFFGLKQLINQDKLNPGDKVIMASSAVGFSWGATVLHYEG